MTISVLAHVTLSQVADLFPTTGNPSPPAVPAGQISNPGPSAAGLPGAAALGTIISWTLYVSLAIVVLAAIASGGAMAIGSMTRNPHLAERGKSTLLWSVLGGIVVGSGITIGNTAFGMGG
jgi:hypothetical protein